MMVLLANLFQGASPTGLADDLNIATILSVVGAVAGLLSIFVQWRRDVKQNETQRSNMVDEKAQRMLDQYQEELAICRQERTEYREERENWEEERYELVSKVSVLEVDRERLERKVATLTMENAKLKAEVAAMRGELEALKNG